MCVSGRTSSEVPGEDLLDDLAPDDRLERIGDRRRPRRHLLRLGAGQEPEVLAADRIDRTEHEHPLVGALLDDGFEARRRALRRSCRSRPGRRSTRCPRSDLRAGRWRCAARRNGRGGRTACGHRARGARACRRARDRGPTASRSRRRRARCPCCTAARAPRAGRRRASAKSSSIVSRSTSSSTNPFQLESDASSLRYSSASRPTMLALSRNGRSFVTTVTSCPSSARFFATARMRWSLLSVVSAAGSVDVS